MIRGPVVALFDQRDSEQLLATVTAARRVLRSEPDTYSRFRRFLGRSILLGLELLVAADIIRTVAITPTLATVGVLAAIVVIRTFLSWTLELEITGRWPWQKSDHPTEPSHEDHLGS